MPSGRTLLVSVTVVFVLGSLLGLALASSGSIAAGSATQATDASNASIQVSTSADVSAPPDRALIQIAVVATGDTAEAARRQVAQNTTVVREQLSELGVAEDQVRTTYYDIRPIDESSGEQQDITGYRAAQGFEIAVDVTPEELGERTGAIVDGVVGNGANQVDGVQFALSEQRREQLRRQALEDAMDDARGEADHLASVSDLSITGVNSISTGGGSVAPVDASRQAAAADSPETVLDPGPVTVSASVTVTYRAG